MNDEQDGSGHTAEQWAAFQKVWGDTLGKLMQLGFTFSPESAPPDLLRQMRAGLLQALAQSWEHFLRSPQFMESTKQWMDHAIAFRKLSTDFFTKVRHETQATSRDDIDTVMLALRHMETRVLDRMEDLTAEVAELRQRLDGAGAKPAAGPAPAQKPSPPPRAPKSRRRTNPRQR